MIDVVILCPLSIEYIAVRQHLDKLSSKKEPNFNLSYEQGVIQSGNKKWKIALFETGGKVGNLQTKTMQILHSLKPQYALLIGIAAGIKDVAVGDIIVGTKAYGYESGKETDEGLLIRPEVIKSSRNLIELTKQMARENPTKDYKVTFGPIASGNKVINSNKGILQIIRTSYNDTKALEMESIGFSKSAQEANVSFLNIRGISDLGVNKHDDFQEEAANRAANFAIQMVQRLPNVATKEVHQIAVFYTTKPFGFFSWRKLKSTTLYISSSDVRFSINNETIRLSNIQELEYFKMQGDFAKNWIRIQLIDNTNYYFSKKRFLFGWGSIFRGSKHLFKILQKIFIKSQANIRLPFQ